ncbi:hypothetical protein PSm6_55710 [Pseudomonas solani]|uniref:Response regulator n=1 Tax=Pseudomonas solani TaxID=2731552 RepID=A0ABM7LHR1_9PSED|nr:hypothetical protein PSm6_55710 [Pseudomonas solani]
MFTSIPKETRIVIIDDITANMRLLESSTRAFGLHHVQGFSDSAKGLEWLIHNPWDLLILDLDMPAPDGFEILRRLGGRNRSRQPVIILTALGDPESRRRGFELGANDYLTKPVDLPELLLRIRNCLQLAYATEHLENMNQDLEAKVRTRTAQLKESYRAGIRALSRAACYRDNDTGDHILRIGEFAALLAATIGMPESWCETLRLAAPMHDLGKIGIADSILLKEGPLTLEERTAMMEHPRIGYSILHEEGGTELIDMAAEIAYCHHEKWDGSGYPGASPAMPSPSPPASSRFATSTTPCAWTGPTSAPGAPNAPRRTSSSNRGGTSTRSWSRRCRPASPTSKPCWKTATKPCTPTSFERLRITAEGNPQNVWAGFRLHSDSLRILPPLEPTMGARHDPVAMGNAVPTSLWQPGPTPRLPGPATPRGPGPRGTGRFRPAQLQSGPRRRRPALPAGDARAP